MLQSTMAQQDYGELCLKDSRQTASEDILSTQPPSSANELLLDAVFTEYKLVMMINLSRDSYYMMEYKNFTQRSCAASGVYEDMVYEASLTMHREDRDQFRQMFSIAGLMAAHRRGEKLVRHVVRQKGNDGVYRKLEMTNYFVKSPSSSDVLNISLCHNIE